MAKRLTHLNPKTTLLLMSDIQEKFRPAMMLFDRFIENTKRLCAACKIFNIPLLVTEQNPAKLGKTVKELDIGHAKAVVPKTVFNMMVPDVEREIRRLFNGGKPCDVIIVGIEYWPKTMASVIRGAVIRTHIEGRSEIVTMGIVRLRDAGCVITTGETIIYELLKDSNDPKFKELRKLLLDRSQDMLINQPTPTSTPTPKSKV
ncbi:hypothetical protein DOY81_010074 [Sarcophaga bullata]|nr:hypothetical protein DOY81_010074 [Sarcophaga bullata]